MLTHARFDHVGFAERARHVGFAERARRELDVPVYVHENDVPLIRHPLQYGHERSMRTTSSPGPGAADRLRAHA